MTFDKYQQKALKTRLMKADDPNLMYYLALGLTGEAGEIANKLKKIIRDHDGDGATIDKDDIKGELGDVLWYLANLADIIGISFDDVATYNAEKLASRKERGVLGGSGDNR